MWSRSSLLLSAALLAGCGPRPVELGDFIVSIDDDGALQIEHTALGSVLEDVRLVAGAGSSDVQSQFGAFRFENTTVDTREHGDVARVRGRRGAPVILELVDPKGASMGTVTLAVLGDVLALEFSPTPGIGKGGDGAVQSPLVGLSAACDKDDHFLGLGGHQLDVDHVGEAFSLWVQEPGVGKEEAEEAEGWPLTGGRHDTSFPVPVVIRPHRAQALILDDTAKIDVDLCHSDPDRFELLAWRDGALRFAVAVSGSPKGAVEIASQFQGTLPLPPPWAFGPWNDAIRGEDRVNEVADRLRSFGASSTAIWTEDWKGADEQASGYRLSGEWTVDETLYPNAASLAASLEARGFHWMAYFSPFLIDPESQAWQDAVADDVILKDADGEPYTFQGASFRETSMVDLSSEAGRSWARDRMQAAVDLGFDGWMADFAEWLPVDAELASGQDAFRYHNAFPLWWQEANAEVLEPAGGVFFVRSGWLGSSGLVPAVWGGDQRTDWQTDDGFPTVIPMGLGLAASGVPVFTHDVAGYNSVGNDPTSRELWFRWASLGAFTPILRTHHGAFDLENWQFDADDESTEHWVAVTREHSKLFPYRYGLAAKASTEGTPMLLPVSFVYPDQPWDRMDAWLLGEGMLVAPVLEPGVEGREVELPSGVRWFRWGSGAEATSGFQAAALDEIPVFVAEGTTIPTFLTAPDTFVESDAVDEELLTLAEADLSRVVYLYGGGGDFTEADGTTYEVRGTPAQGNLEKQATLKDGTVEVDGLTVKVSGPVERDYIFLSID